MDKDINIISMALLTHEKYLDSTNAFDFLSHLDYKRNCLHRRHKSSESFWCLSLHVGGVYQRSPMHLPISTTSVVFTISVRASKESTQRESRMHSKSMGKSRGRMYSKRVGRIAREQEAQQGGVGQSPLLHLYSMPPPQVTMQRVAAVFVYLPLVQVHKMSISRSLAVCVSVSLSIILWQPTNSA